MADTGQQSLSSRTVMEMVCDTLRELRDSEGVTPAMVRQYVRHKYGAEPKGAVSERRLRLELHKGVQEGFLVTKSGRYNIKNVIYKQKKLKKSPSGSTDPSTPSQTTSNSSVMSKPHDTETCGCPSKKRRKSRRCKKRRSRRRKSKGCRKGRMVCKKVCKRVGGGPSLIQRLLSLLTIGGGKGKCKKSKVKKKFSWVRAHCRKNPKRKRRRC